jgi:hypothetical protein
MLPKKIDVESSFTDFVQTFRNAGPLSRFVGKIPSNILNADYYFPQDNVIAELKTIEVDSLDLDTFNRRVMASYKWLGYRFEDYLEWLSGNAYFPDEVSRRLSSTISRPIIESVKKAHKQIASSRKLLCRKDASGLILVANSGNTGFEPTRIMSTILRGFDIVEEKQNNAIVYFTPNVYHDLGDEVPYEIWVPIANEQGDDLQAFVDDLGKAWFDYGEANGRPSATRKADNNLTRLLTAKVVKDWMS